MEIKHKDFIDMFPMPRQNSSWIRSLSIYGEGRTQVSLSLPTTIAPMAQD